LEFGQKGTEYGQGIGCGYDKVGGLVGLARYSTGGQVHNPHIRRLGILAFFTFCIVWTHGLGSVRGWCLFWFLFGFGIRVQERLAAFDLGFFGNWALCIWIVGVG
jgi:hypothetical protein